MADIYTCPECEMEFKEDEANIVIQNMDFSHHDSSIQAVSLVKCPDCGSVVVALFDSMECTEEQADW